MAAALKFELGGAAYEAVPVKVERRKLYGYTDTVATDAVGEVCQAARLDPDGTLIVPPGGVKTGILSAAGKWMDRSELKAVDADGNELPIVPSSFSAPIVLKDEAEEGPMAEFGILDDALNQSGESKFGSVDCRRRMLWRCSPMLLRVRFRGLSLEGRARESRALRDWWLTAGKKKYILCVYSKVN